MLTEPKGYKAKGLADKEDCREKTKDKTKDLRENCSEGDRFEFMNMVYF